MKREHYDAFISYRHIDGDMQIAKKLESLLENYKIRDKTTGKKTRLKVFRDENELKTSGNLGSDICDALDHSDYLIIIYSPTTKESKWCMEELRYFRNLHGNTNDHILPIIVNGEPKDILPIELMYEWKETIDDAGNIGLAKVETEPLCADVRGKSLNKQLSKLKKKEHMRIAAAILGVSFDTLYQRQRRKNITRIAAAACIAFVGISLFGIYNYGMLTQLKDKQNHIVWNESNRIAYLAGEQSDDVKLAITLALTGTELLESGEVAGSDSERVLKQSLIQDEIAKERDYFHVDAVIPMNSRFMLGDTYGGGQYIELKNYTDTYLFDLENGELKFQYDSMDIYFNSDATQYITYTVDGSDYIMTGYDRGTNSVFFQDKFQVPEDDSYFQFAYDEGTDRYYLGIVENWEYLYLKEVSSNGESRDITDIELSDEVKKKLSGDDWNEIVEKINGNYFDFSYEDYTQGKVSGTRKDNFQSLLRSGMHVHGIDLMGESGLESYAVSADSTSSQQVYLINDIALNQIVYKTNRKIFSIEGSNKFWRYRKNGDGIEILSLNKDCIMEKEYERQVVLKTLGGTEYFTMDEYGENVRTMISPDGKKFLKVDDISNEYIDISGTSSGQRLKGLSAVLGMGYSSNLKTAPRYQLTIGDIEGSHSDVFCKMIYGNPRNASLPGNLLFYSTLDMKRVAYVTPEGLLEVVELPSGNILYSKELELSMENPFFEMCLDGKGKLDTIKKPSPNVSAVALDREGKLLAVSYLEGETVVYSVETGDKVQSFYTDEMFGESWISCIEFNDNCLLLSTDGKTVLLPRTETGVYDSTSFKSYEGGEEFYGAPKFLTDDGLLFTTYSLGSDFMLDTIYNVATDAIIDLGQGAQNYCYDSSSGYLVWEDDTQTFRTGAKKVAKRNDEGEFELLGKIQPESYDMQMASHGAILDGNLLLLEKEGRTELFDLSTQTKRYTFNCDKLRIQDGILFDTKAFGTNANAMYNINIEYAELREKASMYITSPLGTRRLSEDERRKYYIDESLYQ